jgi:hypothetical protein
VTFSKVISRAIGGFVRGAVDIRLRGRQRLDG